MPTSTLFRGSHGDMFLMAERKNRMEKARLDKQLKAYDRDSARQEFCVERQKRTLVKKWQGVSLTSGHSDQALPPSGPEDNVYEKSKHGQNKLSEKRLMEWKVRERQLEKFLRQFQNQPHPQSHPHARLHPRPHSSPGGFRPRPSSSCSARAAAASSVNHKSPPPRPATAHVAFSSSRFHGIVGSSEHAGDQLETGTELTGLKERVGKGDDGDAGRNPPSSSYRLRMFQSRLRSQSATSLRPHHPTQDSGRKTSLASKLKSTEDVSSPPLPMSRIPEEQKTSPQKPKTTRRDLARAAETLKSSTRDFKAFLHDRAMSQTTFFVTKDKVVMTNAFEQTCRHVSTSTSSLTDNEKTGSKPQDAYSARDDAPYSDKLSIAGASSCSSEDLADSVFSGVKNEGDFTVAEVDDASSAFSGNVGEHLSNLSLDSDLREKNGIAHVDFQRKDSYKRIDFNTVVEEEEDEQDNGGNVETSGVIGNNVSCRSVQKKLETAQSDPITKTSLSAKKVTIATTSTEGHFHGQGQGQNHVQCHRDAVILSRRRHSHSPSLHRGHQARRLSLQPRQAVGGQEERSPATGEQSRPEASLLNKRRPSGAALFRSCVLSSMKANNNSSPSSPPITSAMTVTPLRTTPITKDGMFARGEGNSSSDYAASGFSQEGSKSEPTANGSGVAIKERRSQVDTRLEHPSGLCGTMSSVGTVVRAALAFSKAARKRALSSLVESHNEDGRETVRQERLRQLTARAQVLSAVVSTFPVGDQ